MKDRDQEPYADTPGYRAGMSAQEFAARFGGVEVVKLGSNENPFGPSPRAVEAVRAAAANLNRYPPATDDSLREALAAYHGGELAPACFVTGNGGADVLSLVARSELDAGSEYIICRPTFPVYELTATLRGARAVYADLDPDAFTFDVDRILGAVSERTRVVYVCNPNNPTGSLCRLDQMRALSRSLPPSVLLVADEVYHDFVSDGHREGSIALLGEAQNLLVVRSFSKATGLAGTRLGYAVTSPEVASRVAAQRLPFHINALTLAAGLAALGDEGHLERTIRAVEKGRAMLYRGLQGLGVTVWPSEANFLLFRTDPPVERVVERLLQRGVIVRPLDGFYLPGYLRVTVGTADENRRFLESLAATIKELKPGSSG